MPTGTHFHLSIGEPWDFRSEAGQGALTIRVTRWPNTQIAFGECSPFVYEKRRVTKVTVVPRHVGGIIAPTHGVNVFFHKSQDIVVDPTKADTLSWLIGSIVKIDGANERIET